MEKSEEVGRIIMLRELYKKLDEYRNGITNLLDINLIQKQEKQCVVSFPEAMFDFYLHFGNDRKVLSSYYIFDEITNVRVENSALTFGYKHQGSARLGITLEKLNGKFQAISWYSTEWEEWFSEGSAFPESFFLNIACWQVLNTMPSIVKIHISQTEFETIVNSHFQYFSKDTVYLEGYNIVSVYSRDILGCYVKDNEDLYLGTQKDDEILEECEEKLNLDFDWL